MVKLQRHVHCRINPLYRKSCDCKKLLCSPCSASFFFFKFSTKFLFLYLHLKLHDRNRIRDSLCQCGVTRESQCTGHLRFRLFLYAMSLKYVRSIRKLKIVCLQFGMFFYGIAAFSVRKVGGIIRCISVFDVILVQLNEWIPILLKCR